MDIHFHGYKIRYEKFDEYFQVIARGTPLKKLNIFINLDDFFHKLHNPLINKEFLTIGQKVPRQMVSNILNLIGHYRHYVLSRLHCGVNVYAIYTTHLKNFKNEIYLKDYRRKFKENNLPTSQDYAIVNQTLSNSYGVMRSISQYIPGIYIIDSSYIEPSVIPLYLSKKQKADWNVIISRDNYDLQYATKEKWVYISPKGDNTSILSGEHLWDYIAKKESILDEKEYHYPTIMFPPALSVVGDKYRSIPRLRRLGWRTIYRFIAQIMEEYRDYDDITKMIEFLDLLREKRSLENEKYLNNFRCIDIDSQVDSMLELDRLSIDQQLIDRFDSDALEEANRRIFISCPLRLEFLLN